MEKLKSNRKFFSKLNLKSFIITILLFFLASVLLFSNFHGSTFFNLSVSHSVTNSSSNSSINLSENANDTNESYADEMQYSHINEPSTYAEKSEEKNPYHEDTLHMVYFAVYFIDYVPSSKTENLSFQTMYLAPQKSSPAMVYDEEKGFNSSTVCKLTYAEKEFYIYDDDCLAHNREYKMKDHYSEKLIDMPKAEVVSANNGYKYVGYTYSMQTSTKYKSTKLLPSATKLNGITETDIVATQKSNGYENIYNITISFYFYKPSNLYLSSLNEEYGRFSDNPNMSFDRAYTKIHMIVQEGLKIQIDNFKTDNPNLVARVTGTKTYIKNSKLYSKEVDNSYYMILNKYCHLKNKSSYSYFNNKGYHISFSFTQEVFNLSFKINTSLSHAENMDIYASYGSINRKISPEIGTDKTTKIVLENIPAGELSSLAISVSYGKSDYKYVVSKTPITEFLKNQSITKIIVASEMFTLDKDTEIKGIVCYIYELYELFINARTDKKIALTNYYYKINGIDMNLPTTSRIDVDGFKFFGYSLNEDSLDIVTTLKIDDNITLFANWEKEFVATFYYAENNIHIPGFENYGTHKISKKFYNFNTATNLTIDSLPQITSKNFVGYTDNPESYENIINFEIGEKIKFGDTYYGVYKYQASFKYDLSHLGNDVTLSGNIPDDVEVSLYEIVYGKCEYFKQVTVTDNVTFTKKHFDFMGWSTASGGSNDVSSYYQSGDIVTLRKNDEIVLYPILDDHPYYITIELSGGRYENKKESKDIYYNEEENTVTYKVYNYEVFYFPNSNVLKDGYKISKVTALVNPENFTNYTGVSYYYNNIEENEILLVEWEITRYKVNINLVSYIPNGEGGFDVNVKYRYYDELLQETINGSEILNSSNKSFTLDLLNKTNLKLEASIEVDNFNLAFAERSGIENKTCSYSYTSTGDGSLQYIQLLLTRVYKIHLMQRGVTSGNEHEIVYKYYAIELRLPKNIGEMKGYSQTAWNTSEDGTGSSLYKINSSINEEMTLYATWSKYVKFYLYGSTEYNKILYPNKNDTYSFGFLRYFSITVDDINYDLVGFSSRPDSTDIEYYGEYKTTFTDSVSWYGIYRTTELTTTIYEDVDVSFHLYDRVIEKTINRSITYSNYNTYYNADFTVETKNFDGATITYSNDTIEFIDDEVNDYMIYGWNKTGKCTDKFFTKEDEIIVEDLFDFYPIYRTINYDETNLKHMFFFNDTTKIIRMSTIYKLSNTFNVYNFDFSSETSMTDTINYKSFYGNLKFDTLSMFNPYKSNKKYTFLGWETSPSSLTVSWESGEIEVSESTSWYAVWKITDEETKQETLTHTFFLGEDNIITKTTTKTEKIKNIITITSYDGQIKSTINEGEIYETTYSNLEYLDLSQDNSQFYGWTIGPNSVELISNFNKYSSFAPEGSLSLYPVYIKYFNLNIKYSSEEAKDIVKYLDVPVFTNFDSSVVLVISSNTSALPYTIEDIDWTHENNRFLGWSFVAKDDAMEDIDDKELEIYLAGDTILIENIKEKTFLTFFAILKQPEIIKVSITINDEVVEKDYLEGDTIELINLEDIEGKVFKHWKVNDEIYRAGETVSLTKNTGIIAVYASENENNKADNENNSQKEKGSKTVVIVLVAVISCIVIVSAFVASVILIKKNQKKQSVNLKKNSTSKNNTSSKNTASKNSTSKNISTNKKK